MSRNWVFTLNNPTSNIDLSECQALKFLIATLEMGESGTIHYQGYLELTNSRKLPWLKTLIPQAHWEIRRGSRATATEYCLKTLELDTTSCPSSPSWKDSESNTQLTSYANRFSLQRLIYQSCDVPWQDVASLFRKITVKERLAAIQTSIQTGTKTELDIANSDFELWVKYRKAFSEYKLLISQPRSEKTECIVIQGPTGTGKSKWARDNYPGAYWKPRSNWWDGYTNQSAIIIDEFYGWLPFDLLLRLCDRYPLNVEIKGGAVNFNPKTIIITTNKRPDLWYTNVYFPSFIRRVEQWKIFGETQVTYTNYEEVEFL